MWRGVTTGSQLEPANRFDLVTKYFSAICNRKEKYSKYVKSKMTIHEMLKYKYIISVNGNDKDSGINWKLASNSVVFMAKPKYISWLMESELVPNYHYVLLDDDFSNLIEKLEWCNKHPEICKQIIKNAHDFMDRR